MTPDLYGKDEGEGLTDTGSRENESGEERPNPMSSSGGYRVRESSENCENERRQDENH